MTLRNDFDEGAELSRFNHGRLNAGQFYEVERDRYREALAAIVRHADMPDGESWEQAYVEVTTMARAALPGGRP